MRRRISVSNVNETLKLLIKEYQIATSKNDKGRINKSIRDLIANYDRTNNPVLCFFYCEEGPLGIIEDIDMSGLDLRGIDFSDMHFINANFSGSDLSDASFQGKNYRQRTTITANFDDANCTNVIFDNCDIRSSTFKSTKVSGLKLSGAWVSRNNLELFLPFAKSTIHDVPQLSLAKISLEDENLSYLNMNHLFLIEVYFKSSNLFGTIFGNSDVRGCYFKGAKNFNPSQLASCLNEETCTLNGTHKRKYHTLKQATSCIRPISTFFLPNNSNEDEKENVASPSSVDTKEDHHESERPLKKIKI